MCKMMCGPFSDGWNNTKIGPWQGWKFLLQLQAAGHAFPQTVIIKYLYFEIHLNWDKCFTNFNMNAYNGRYF